MHAYRDGNEIVMCDGCFRPEGKPFQTADGRLGHVCSHKCAMKFENTPPLDFRGLSEAERKAHTQEIV